MAMNRIYRRGQKVLETWTSGTLGLLEASHGLWTGCPWKPLQSLSLCHSLQSPPWSRQGTSISDCPGYTSYFRDSPGQGCGSPQWGGSTSL